MTAAARQREAPNTQSDTRRITEQDPDFLRLRARTRVRLSASVSELVHDLRTRPSEQHGAVLSEFITRHVGILHNAYLAAHAEGLRDYFGAVSRQHPRQWQRYLGRMRGAPDERTVRQRLGFYAPSVAKLAHEAQLAWHKAHIEQVFAEPLDSHRAIESFVAYSERLDRQFQLADGDALSQWQDSLGVRLQLQSDLTWSGMQDGYRDGGALDPANLYRSLWWDLEPGAQHCADCPDYADGSPYDPYGTAGGNILDATPGDGHTSCGAACKCSLRYGSASASENAMNAAPFDPARVLPTAMPLTPIQEVALRNLPPVGATSAGPLNDGQKAALDLYRATAYAWDEWRGVGPSGTTLPALPPFADLWDPTSGAMDQWAEALPRWEQLTAKQQQLFWQMFEAIFDWGAASPQASRLPAPPSATSGGDTNGNGVQLS